MPDADGGHLEDDQQFTGKVLPPAAAAEAAAAPAPDAPAAEAAAAALPEQHRSIQ